jgi:hypothetical protein
MCMYAPLTRLGDYVGISKRRQRFRERWKTKEGQKIRDALLSAITSGEVAAVQRALRTGPKGFFDGSYDLRGLHFVNFKLNRPENDLLQAATLNYSRLREVHIIRATFESTLCNFVDSVRARFEDCTFVRATFYSATFEDCVFENCNFLDRDTFSNCSFRNVTFENCFFETDIFTDCEFDERTKFSGTRNISHRFSYLSEPVKKFDNKYLSSLYREIHEAYEAGHAGPLSRQYLFMERQAYTRHNTRSRSHKLTLYILEYTNGYGIRPLRVLLTSAVIFTIFTAIFIAKFGTTGFLISSGGFFTFGADTDLLSTVSVGYHILYFFEAFLGVTNVSIFVVVLTNYWSLLR